MNPEIAGLVSQIGKVAKLINSLLLPPAGFGPADLQGPSLTLTAL